MKQKIITALLVFASTSSFAVMKTTVVYKLSDGKASSLGEGNHYYKFGGANGSEHIMSCNDAGDEKKNYIIFNNNKKNSYSQLYLPESTKDCIDLGKMLITATKASDVEMEVSTNQILSIKRINP